MAIVSTQYAFEFEPRKPAMIVSRRRHHAVFAALVFVAAYLTTITVNAQPQQDSIVFGQNELTSVTGTVKEADEDWVVITTAGKDMRIDLGDVHMKTEADTVFTPGMNITADGRMNGEDFGVPVMKAKSIAATAPAAGGVLVDQQ